MLSVSESHVFVIIPPSLPKLSRTLRGLTFAFLVNQKVNLS